MKHPEERRPGLPRESAWTLYLRHARELIVNNVEYMRRIWWIQSLRRRIEKDLDRQNYKDRSLDAIDEGEEEAFDYLTKTDGAKAAIEHLKKIAELTHKVPARAAE